MPIWTSPLPATPILTAPPPTTPTTTSPLPAAPVVIIDSATIPPIQPSAVASYSGSGSFTAPYLSSQPYPVVLGSIGFLAVEAIAWTDTNTPALTGVGGASASVKVGSGGAVVAAGFNGVGSLQRPDGPFGDEGVLSVTVTPSAVFTAAYSGVGATTAAVTQGAMFSGTGVLSAAAAGAAPVAEPVSGIGSLGAAVVVFGTVTTTAAFGSEGILTAATGGSEAPATVFTGTGALSTLIGALAQLTGSGKLAALSGSVARFDSAGTLTAPVAIPAYFNAVAVPGMRVNIVAAFTGGGVLSAVFKPSSAALAAGNGSGVLSATSAVVLTAGFTGAGTLYGTEFVEMNANATGTGTASLAVLWSENEAGAFNGSGQLSMVIAGPGPAFALVMESPLYTGVSTPNEAYGLWFAPNALDETQV